MKKLLTLVVTFMLTATNLLPVNAAQMVTVTFTPMEFSWGEKYAPEPAQFDAETETYTLPEIETYHNSEVSDQTSYNHTYLSGDHGKFDGDKTEEVRY